MVHRAPRVPPGSALMPERSQKSQSPEVSLKEQTRFLPGPRLKKGVHEDSGETT